jgi:hypothetical protein
MPIGMVETSTSMSIETPISIEISTETKPNKTCRNEDKVIKGVRESGSITRSIAKACRIETRELRKNLTGPAVMTRFNHGNSFADEPTKDGKI